MNMNDLELLLRTPFVDPEYGFDISPDGSKVAFSWNTTGNWEIYEMPIDGSSGGPVRISSGDGGKFAPKYSPDGLRLTFAVDLNGSENFHIFMVDLVTRVTRDLTEAHPPALNTNYSWDPDGKGIAVLSILENLFQVNILYLDGNLPRQVIEFKQPVWDVHWSPTGDFLAVVVEMDGSDSGIVIVNLENGKETWISLDTKTLNAKNPAWSPDGLELAFSSNPSGFYNIGVFGLEDKRIRWMTDGETEKTRPVWSPDGSKLAYIQWEGCNRRLVIQDLAEEPIKVAIEQGLHNIPRFSPDGKNVLVVFENHHLPPDLWRYSLEDRKFNQLTNSKPDILKDFQFVVPEEVSYPGLDGVEVPALLYRSTGIENNSEVLGAGVVNIHGGPDWLYQISWNPFMSYMASKGWIVLAPNYRGSIGYGRAWQIASRYEMGKMDSDDIVAGAHFLIKERLADASRIAVTGRSHGGYLTMTCLTQHPDLWAGGVAIVPVLNLLTSHKEARQDLQNWNIENYGDPVENHDLWVERSPFFFLDRIQAPVQFTCGVNDVRCPSSDAIAAYEKLVELGKRSELWLYPDEGHVFLKISNIIDSFTRIINFLSMVLEGSDI